MRSPHFFKAYCRLGLINPPVHSNEFNIGVEEAPGKILDEDFIKKFSKHEVTDYFFPNPEDVKKEDYWQLLAQNLKAFKDLINQNLKENEIQIVVGGDNSVTFSSLIAIQDRLKDPLKLGYIQIDSHGEANKVSSSPSGNFHGMYMRPFWSDDFEIEEINQQVRHKIPIKNVLCIGNQELDGDEPQFYLDHKIRVINRKTILPNKEKIIEELKDFISDFEHIHINFDIDIFDKSISSATGIALEDGFYKEDIFPLLEVLKAHPSWSLDLVEVNPKKAGAEETIKLAQEILKFILI